MRGESPGGPVTLSSLIGTVFFLDVALRDLLLFTALVSAFLPVEYLDSQRGFLLCYRSAMKLWCHQADDSFGVAWVKTFHPEATALVKTIISLTISFFLTCKIYSSFGIVDVIVEGKAKS